MVKLRVLGTLDLLSDAAHPAAPELLAKSKPTALLVYLVLAHPGAWCRRDRLAEMFWPESDQQHARRALSQAIYQARRHLGPSAIDTRGTEDVRAAPEAIGCDALDLRRELADGKLEEALALYAGTLLPAFHVTDAGPFTDWLEGERSTLHRTVVRAALTLAKQSHDPAVARRWYTWAVSQDPLDGGTVTGAMTALARAEAHHAALDLYAIHRNALRRELELEPSPDLVALADRIRAMLRSAPALGGTRSTAAVQDKSPIAEGSVTPDPAAPAPPSRRIRRLTTILAVGVAIVVGIQLLAPHAGGRTELDPGLVAVLPFRYEGSDDRDRWLASALPVGLVPLLDGTGGLSAVPEQRMSLALAAHGKSWDSSFDADEAMALARAVGAGTYFTATVTSDGTNRRVSATLTRTESGEQVEHVEFAIDTLDVNAAIDRLQAEMLIRAAGKRQQVAELLTYSTPALREYVDGAVARRQQRYLDAMRHFAKAMDLDSTFALAALAYRETSLWLPDGTPHRLALERADSMDRWFPNRLSEADRAVSDAIFQTHRLDRDGRATLHGVRQATLVAPDRPTAWMLLGDFLLHDGRMLGLHDHLALAAAAFDSVRALGDPIPEAERHLVEIRFAERDTAFARSYLASHPRDPQNFSHLWWVAASLIGDGSSLADFGRTLDREQPSTWRWMLLWSQRAETGFAQADRAAVLLHDASELDSLVRRGNNYILALYALNRGRPDQALAGPGRRLGNPGLPVPAAVWRLEVALATPPSWMDRDSTAATVAAEFDQYPHDARLLAACDLGLWHAARGDAAEARRMAGLMAEWQNHPDVRFRTYAVACPTVIRGALDTTQALTGLREAAAYLGDEPAGVLRHDITRWSLYLADLLAARGQPALALPLTTRLGYVVEESAWLTPALIREADLSLVVGDTARAAVAYQRAARLLSDPGPELRAEADRVRRAAQRLSEAAHHPASSS